MFSALHAEKAALLRRKNAFGRTTAFRATYAQPKQKAIPYGMTFCFGGDKRDRTADLMTASCDRFVILSVFTSNPSVPSAKSAGFCKVLSIASTRFRAHLGHNLGQGGWGVFWRVFLGGMGFIVAFFLLNSLKRRNPPTRSTDLVSHLQKHKVYCVKNIKQKQSKIQKFILTMLSRYSIL